MSVPGSRKRSSNAGHNLDGVLVTYENGTTGFRQNVGTEPLPKTAFGQLDVAERTPQVQVKFPYGINDLITQTLLNNTSGGSEVTATKGVASITAAGSYPSFAQIRSYDTVRYGPGQGAECMFTAAFPSGGVALSEQHVGAGDDDEGFFFGYEGENFSIEHHLHGALEIRNLVITAGASGSGDITITLDGSAVTVAITSGWTIAQVTEAIVAETTAFGNAARGWEVRTNDNICVEFISLIARNATDTFSFVDTGTTGVTADTFNQATTDVLGAHPSEGSVAQSDWNVDPMDGLGPSGVLMGFGVTPTNAALALENLNVFRIQWQYLGAGSISYFIEVPSGGWQLVHVIQRAGSSAEASLSNPTLHMNVIAKTEDGYSGGDLTIKTASMAGFIQGKETLLGVRHSAHATLNTSSTTPLTVLTIDNSVSYQGTRNKTDVYPDQLTLAYEGTKTATISLVLNPTRVDGTVALTEVSPTGDSPVKFDTAGTTVVGGIKLVEFSIESAQSKEVNLKPLDMYLRPGDRWVFTATISSGGAADVHVGVTWLERV
jgi:hypothetical protein